MTPWEKFQTAVISLAISAAMLGLVWAFTYGLFLYLVWGAR